MLKPFLKDPVEFVKYCKETKEAYQEELSWYPLNPTGHKVTDHPEHYLPLFPDTIGTGMTSEEPAEAANKDIKCFQIEHAWQGDPIRRNLDTFHRYELVHSGQLFVYFLLAICLLLTAIYICLL